MEEQNIKTNEHLPVYNIKAVSHLLGLLPVTLRAWERRYGLPTPQRGEQGYRLYSEYDMRTLRWLKNQLELGLSIGRAVQYLTDLRKQGKDPAASASVIRHEQPASLTSLSEEFFHALLQIDDPHATETLRRAFALYPIDNVLVDIIQPALIEMGEAWHRGEIPIATEHFGTAFCMQHLMSMLNSASPPSHSGLIVAACAPGETHEIGLLIIVVMLRWRGWQVKYLGPNLQLDRLEEILVPMRPQMLLFSATRPESAHGMENLSSVLSHFPGPTPLVVLGGQAFQVMHLSDEIPAIYLHTTPSKMIDTIEDLMNTPER